MGIHVGLEKGVSNRGMVVMVAKLNGYSPRHGVSWVEWRDAKMGTNSGWTLLRWLRTTITDTASAVRQVLK